MNAVESLHRALIARGYREHLLVNEPMARHTTFDIGGPADLLLEAHTPEEIQTGVHLAWEHHVPCLVLGSGSNVLVADAGVRGLVIINASCGFAVDAQGLMVAQSGMLLRELAQWAVTEGWGGLEWAVGVPGTLGGAVVGNAGAYGGCMADSVRWVTLLPLDGAATERIAVDALQYGYRSSALKSQPATEADTRAGGASAPSPRAGALKGVVLEAALQLQAADPAELARIAARNDAQRRVRTPEGCCAGSIFKRTMQYPAGFLIEQAGLKGRRIGGVQVSPLHANFLMNTGGTTAAEVKALIEVVQKEVFAAFGQRLEPEIEFVGAW